MAAQDPVARAGEGLDPASEEERPPAPTAEARSGEGSSSPDRAGAATADLPPRAEPSPPPRIERKVAPQRPADPERKISAESEVTAGHDSEGPTGSKAGSTEEIAARTGVREDETDRVRGENEPPGTPAERAAPPDAAALRATAETRSDGMLHPNQGLSASAVAGTNGAGARATETSPAANPPILSDPSVSQGVAHQVIRGARFLLKDDVSEVRIRLEPPELGSVHIRLLSGDRSLSGEISVSSAEVKGIVEANLHQLRSSLTEQGLQMGQIDVSVRDGRSGGAWPDATGAFGNPWGAPDGRQGRGWNPTSGSEEGRPEDRPPLRGQNLVDYFA
jgi:flagellar hook-length control protein FliK